MSLLLSSGVNNLWRYFSEYLKWKLCKGIYLRHSHKSSKYVCSHTCTSFKVLVGFPITFVYLRILYKLAWWLYVEGNWTLQGVLNYIQNYKFNKHAVTSTRYKYLQKWCLHALYNIEWLSHYLTFPSATIQYGQPSWAFWVFQNYSGWRIFQR